MFNIRPFRNSDPPQLVEVWQAQPTERGLVSSVDVLMLEHFVLSKPWFDRFGLLVAEREGRVVGFVHAGFGPNATQLDLNRELGVICTLQLMPQYDSNDLRGQLLHAAEEYLKFHGSRSVVGGAYPPNIPFYHGLFRSSELPGVFAADEASHRTFLGNGYEVAEQFSIMNCQLGRLRPVIDRNQRQLQRSFMVRPTLDHTFSSWWKTCAFGPIQRSQFEVVAKLDNMPCGALVWWDADLSTMGGTGVSIALGDLQIEDARRRVGLATFLVSNALKQLKSSGATTAQVQVPISNTPGVQFFRKLGFVEQERGTSYRKAF